jgi:hypothetical protein
MSLPVATKPGPCEIFSLIGMSGIGEMCRVRHTRLSGIAALQVSKVEFAERFARFQTINYVFG